MTSDISSYINRWQHLLQDLLALKILFYLREYNPNVSVRDLTKNLVSSQDEIEKKIKMLLNLEIIEKQANGDYRLSEMGRIVTNRFYHSINQIPPK